MPTYICTISRQLTNNEKVSVADAITRIHSEEGRAPAYLVHVVFTFVPPGDRFINRRRVSENEVWIHGHIRAGRTSEQKAAIATRTTAEVSEALGLDKSYVWVYVSDLAAAAEFGSLLPAPGEEADWYAALPQDVKERYGMDGGHG